MDRLAQAVLITWRRNGAYGLRLVSDLSAEQFAAQPVRGRVLNHPAWVLSHLNVYMPVVAAMVRGEEFVDPIDHRYGQKSEVSLDPAEYAPGAELVAAYQAAHLDAERALAGAASEVLAGPNPVERWRTMHPTVGDMVVTLMVKHESGHLGQLSAWRRAMGLARVAI